MPNDGSTDPRDWAILEARVRRMASYIFGAPALPENVNGVNVDAVVKREPDYWVCIEITVSNTLEKLRADLAKFASVRPFLASQNIFAKCIFVCAADVPPSLRVTGQGANVLVQSVEEFERSFFDFVSYETARRMRPFGSAVNPISGKNDESEYVPVKYTDRDGTIYSVPDIAARLLMGRKIILLGEYGTGKSRCFREVFTELAKNAVGTGKYPIAIDLRENWGSKRGHEIVRRHFDELGLSDKADSIVKVFDQGSLIYLLDGFDEIGSQAWSDDQNKLRSIRAQSLAGVRDLLTRTAGGAIVSGRAHYFNSDEEMFSALGLKKADTIVLLCQNEFTAQEMEQFLARINVELALPVWLPRRPLICQTIAGLDENELDRMFMEEGGDVEFWHRLMDVICEREARIAPPLDPGSIRNVLRYLARATRAKAANVGPLSPAEVGKAFEDALGFPPVDESAIMLQRLFSLGRLAVESSDRQFIDVFILDGLRGLDVTHVAKTPAEGCENEPWANPLQALGQAVASTDVRTGDYEAKRATYVRHAKKCSQGRNTVLASDIVGTLLAAGSGTGVVDFSGTQLDGGHLSLFDGRNAVPANLTVRDSVIEELYLPAAEPVGTKLLRCVVGTMHGIASAKGVPAWVEAPSVDTFETVSTTSQIRNADLTPNQRILVAMIKKTFFQKGAGRKEEALLRGLGATAQTGDPSKILNLLIRENVLDPHKGRGSTGMVYSPNRSIAARMRLMISELTLSKDPIWEAVSKMKNP